MIERRIIIGLITSKEYLTQIKGIWNITLIQSGAAKFIATWCWGFFDKYDSAPNKEIESIFHAKVKEGKIQKDIANEIEEEILPGLSDEYESSELNIPALVDDTKKYFTERYLTLHKDELEGLLAKGNIEKAEKLVTDFKPLSILSSNLGDYILTINQIERKDRPHRALLMKPWLREGQMNIVYGNYGSGKSLLMLSIAYVLGLRDYDRDECEIGPWQVKKPAGTLYIDGELGEQEMQERIKQFEWMGKQPPEYRLRVLSIPEYQIETESQFELSKRENQLKIIEWLKANPTYKLVIFDSVSTLFGIENENDNSEWNNKVNPLLRDLRAIGVACIILHHSGKDGKRGLRGASSMGAMAENIFRLTNHESKNIDAGEAWFVLTKDKQRASGFSFKTFALKYTQSPNKAETHWEETKIN